MKIESDIKLDFSNVLIRPKRSILNSRSEVQLEREFKFLYSNEIWKGIPIIASNMDTIGTLDVYKVLSKFKIITALHKFYKLEDLQKENLDSNYFMITTGISENDYNRLVNILDNFDVKWICIDIANGYIKNLVDFCKKIRNKYPNKIIIAVNVVSSTSWNILTFTSKIYTCCFKCFSI